MKNVGFVLNEYFKSQNITQQQVADLLGKKQPQIAQILTGKSALGKKLARLFADTFGFSYTFLLTGEGELFDTPEQKVVIATNADVEKNIEPQSAEYWKAKYEAAQEEIDRLNELVRIALGGATQKVNVG